MFTLLEDRSKCNNDPHKVYAVASGEPRFGGSNKMRAELGAPRSPCSPSSHPRCQRFWGPCVRCPAAAASAAGNGMGIAEGEGAWCCYCSTAALILGLGPQHQCLSPVLLSSAAVA